jgi:hypothetical protein
MTNIKNKKALLAVLKLNPPKDLNVPINERVAITVIKDILYQYKDRYILYIISESLFGDGFDFSYYSIYNFSNNMIENSYISLQQAISYFKFEIKDNYE